MAVSEAQKRAQAKFDAENTVRVSLKLNRRTDADVIAWLEKQPSKSGAIKEAIRKGAGL